MKTTDIGQSGLQTSVLGLGCMAMSEFYGAFDDAESLKTLERAMEIGITMLDTADLYGDGRNEDLLGRFLKQTSHTPLIASKCGIVRTDEIMSDGNFKRERCGKPDYITASCEKSLKRLGVDVIDLYYLHRIDPNVPVEDSMGALADLKAAGKIRAIGLSEPSADELRRANTVAPVDAVQSEYSLWTRLVEDEVLPLIRATGAALVCYSPLGRGLLRKTGTLPTLDADDFRRTLPRFQQDSLDANADLFDLLDEVAAKEGISVPQLMLVWLLSRGEDIIPIPGARKINHLEQNAAAVDISIDPAALVRLSDAFASGAVAGGRYTEGKAVKTA